MTGEPASAASHRLHNSGPGIREVFRCAPIGSERPLDLYRAICRCRAVSDAGIDSVRPPLPLGGPLHGPEPALPVAALARIPPASIAAIGVALIEALDGRLPPTLAGEDARRAEPVLRAVLGLVTARGWHAERLGIVRHFVVSPDRWMAKERIGCSAVSVEELAFTLAAFAVYAPPLLLWSRSPTTDWLRVDVCLRLRTLWGAGGAL